MSLYINTLFNDDVQPEHKTKIVRAFIQRNPEYNRKYYDKNILKYRQKTTCNTCGGKYLYPTKGRHMTTNKHIKALNNSPQNIRSGEPGEDGADIITL